jgi:hypothetical protein
LALSIDAWEREKNGQEVAKKAWWILGKSLTIVGMGRV